MSKKIVLHEIVVLKGIAICAVVFVHMPMVLVGGIFETFKYYLLALQSLMPVFMFASGFLYGFSDIKIKTRTDYVEFISKKFKRLMVPYFVISLLILAIKYAGGKFVHLYHPVDENFWIYLFFKPMAGFAQYLWFIYVLFLIFVIVPVLRIYFNKLSLFIILLIIYFIPIRYTYFELISLKQFIVYFFIGYMLAAQRRALKMYLKYLFPVSFVSLVFLLSGGWELVCNLLNGIIPAVIIGSLYKLIVGASQVLFFYYVAIILTEKKESALFRLFEFLGAYSSGIYLLHTIAMGVAQILLLKLFRLSENMYPYLIAVVFLLGIILPFLAVKYFIGKNKILTQLMLGVGKYP